MVQTPAVEELKETANVELAVALNVGAGPKVCVPGLAKVIVWSASGVTEFDAAEGCPVPVPFVAVTVKV
jgi:hypothetical protein